MRIETQILSNLVNNEEYVRKTIPFLKPDYFTETDDRIVYEKISQYVEKYNNPPSKSALLIALQDDRKISEDIYVQCETLINSLNATDTDQSWLIDETEKFCKDKAVFNAIMDAIQIIDALSVGFDNNVGHDYIEDADARFDFYNRVEEKIPFDLEFFNKITQGGLSNKSLNIALAGTGVGKSLFMCHMAAAAIEQGKNVLYITLEMSEEKIAERIDANLMNVPIQELSNLPKKMFDDRVNKIKSKIDGKLIIKEYPTASAHAGHFKALTQELKLKRSFSPDIIFIDYLNICSSSRFRTGSNANSYTIIKSIAEELRGLAVEQDLPIVSATQTTRGGYDNSDVSLTDTSESFGLPATADLMFALISTEELEAQQQIMVKQLKNRYNDINVNKRFMVGVDRSKMRLFDLTDEVQKTINDSGQNISTAVFDNGDFSTKMSGNFGSIKV
jgi:replicative DNA helicase